MTPAKGAAMVSFSRVGVAFAVLFGAFTGSCTPPEIAQHCGSFTFSPEAPEALAPVGSQGQFALSYQYNGGTCPVQGCTQYWFIQAIRPWDMDSGKFIQPNGTQQARTVTGNSDDSMNGWAIDRAEGFKFAWYHLNDDLSLEQSGIPGEVTAFGTGTTPATMHDTLNRGDKWTGKRMMITGLTVAVGLQGPSCHNRILGIQKWLLTFGHNDQTAQDTADRPTKLPVTADDMTSFINAVNGWNYHLDDGRNHITWNGEWLLPMP